MSYKKTSNPFESADVVLDSIPLGVVIIEQPKGIVSYINARALELYGYDPRGSEMEKHLAVVRLHKIDGSLYPPEELPASRALLRGEIVRNMELVIERPDGSSVTVLASAVPLFDNEGRVRSAVSIFDDVTERKKMDEILRRYSEHLEELVDERTKELRISERMAIIGRVASMVGHDIRNPLQTIEGALYLARDELSNLPQSFERKKTIQDLLDAIDEQMLYIGKIVSDLQDLSKPIKPELVETDYQQLIDGTLRSVLVPREVEVSVAVEDNLPKIKVDPEMMKRVLINLVTNGVQAMPNGGKLTIKAFRKGERFCISVQDTGVGIPDEVKPKLFEPLFTTKPKGQGFGLAIIKRIVEAHQAEIYFDSEVGKGTSFTIEIPNKNL